MERTKILMWAIVSLMLVGGVSALSCTFAEEPSYTSINNIYWNCITNEETTCYSYIKYNSSLIQARPYPSQQKNTEEVSEGFDCNGICNIKFDDVDLRHNRSVTFGVRCEGDTYEQNITPQHTSEYTSEMWFGKWIWLKDNGSYILLYLIIFFSVLAAIAFMIKIIMGGY